MKHTPTPWIVIPPSTTDKRWFISRRPGCGDVPPNKFYITILEGLNGSDQDKADSEFIVKACNRYEKLRQLLEEAIIFVEKANETDEGETLNRYTNDSEWEDMKKRTSMRNQWLEKTKEILK